MRPMLATPGTGTAERPDVPAGAGWAHEIKWDGIRLVAQVKGGVLRLTTRSERDVTVAFPVGWGGWINGFAPELAKEPRGHLMMVFALP